MTAWCNTDNTCAQDQPYTNGCGCTQWPESNNCHWPSKVCTNYDSHIPVPANPKEALNSMLLGALHEELDARIKAKIVS